MSTAYDEAMKRLGVGQKAWMDNAVAPGTQPNNGVVMPEVAAGDSAFANIFSGLNSDAYNTAMEGHTAVDRFGNPLDVPQFGGGNRLIPKDDVYDAPFTKDDIVDSIAPKAPGKKKMSKPQAKKRAAVKRAVKPQVQARPKAQKYATVDPLNLFGNKNGVNPFGRRNEAMTNARFSGGNVPVKESAFAKSKNPLDLF